MSPTLQTYTDKKPHSIIKKICSVTFVTANKKKIKKRVLITRIYNKMRK